MKTLCIHVPDKATFAEVAGKLEKQGHKWAGTVGRPRGLLLRDYSPRTAIFVGATLTWGDMEGDTVDGKEWLKTCKS